MKTKADRTDVNFVGLILFFYLKSNQLNFFTPTKKIISFFKLFVWRPYIPPTFLSSITAPQNEYQQSECSTQFGVKHQTIQCKMKS